MLTYLFQGSLFVICVTAFWLALDSRVQTGIIGTAALGGVAAFSVSACVMDPPNWLVGQTASVAVLCAWGAGRELNKRRRISERIRSLL